MSYTDQTKTRRRIDAFTEDVMFSKLLKETIDVIHALKIFYEVGTQIRAKESAKYPTCQIRPHHCERVEQHLSGARFHNDYYFNPVFIVKTPSDSIATQQVLFLAEKVRAAFASSSSGPYVFSAISEHFNTNIEPIEIEPLQLIDANTMVFNSGINIVFSVWEAQ